MEHRFSMSRIEDWSPPDYETALEMPANVSALERVGERLFAILDNDRTVEVTSLFGNSPRH